jgi:hypothetical protein
MMPNKFAVDLSNVDQTLNPKTRRVSQTQVVKVAFDIVRFPDDPAAKLWKIENTDQGDYIIALYQDDETPKTGAWEVVLSKTSSTLNVFYKGEQITSLATSKIGIPASELDSVAGYLPAKLASSPSLVQSLLNDLPAASKQAVLTKYPEIA